VRLKRALLDKLGFKSFAGFELTEEARELLGITPAEEARLQGVLDELQKRAQAHDAANTKEITMSDLADKKYATFVATLDAGDAAQITLYSIGANSAEDRAATQDWLNQSVDDALGADRGAVFLEHAQDPVAMALGGNTDRIVAFKDEAQTGDEPPTHTNWLMYYDGNVTGNYGEGTVPKELRYLFQPAGNSTGAGGN